MPAWLQRDWCSSFVLALGHFLWQGTLIAVVLAIALRATKTVSVRYWLSLAALLVMALSPMVTLGWLLRPMSHVVTLDAQPIIREEPAPSQPIVPAAPFEETSDVGQVSNLPVNPPISPLAFNATTTIPPQPPADDRSWWQKFAPQLTTLYLCGVALMLLRLVFGLWGGRRLRRRVHLIDDPSLLAAMRRQAAALGLKLLPVLAYCERVTVPTVVGVLKPMILLPLTLTSGLSPEQIESVLAHELAHLRRSDHLVNLLQRVIESLLFFHPALWWVSHHIRDEREHCCDDLVVACGAMPLDYAKSLLVVAELSRASPLGRSVAAVSLLATGNQKPSHLRQRIARLLGESATPSLRVSPRVLTMSAVVVLAGLATLMQLATSEDQISPTRSERQLDPTEPPIPESKPLDSEVAFVQATPTPDDEQRLVEELRRTLPKDWVVERRFGAYWIDRRRRVFGKHFRETPDVTLHFAKVLDVPETPPMEGDVSSESLGPCRFGYCMAAIREDFRSEWPAIRQRIQSVLPMADPATTKSDDDSSTGIAVAGRLLFEDGQPVVGALVGPMFRKKSPLGDDGRFKLRVAPEWSRFRIHLLDANGWPSPRQWPRQAEHKGEVLDVMLPRTEEPFAICHLRLDRTKLHAVKLLWKGESVAARVTVQTYPSGNWLSVGQAPADGKPNLGGRQSSLSVARTLDVTLRQGETLSIPDVAPGDGTLRIVPIKSKRTLLWNLFGDERDERLELDPAQVGSVEFRITGAVEADAQESPLGFMLSRIMPRSGFGLGSAFYNPTDPYRLEFDPKAESYRVSNLQPGSYHVMLLPEGGTSSPPVTFTITAGQTEEIELPIPKPARSERQKEAVDSDDVSASSSPRSGSGSPTLAPTAGLPNSDEDTKQPNNANGDLRSKPTAGPGDPRPAQDKPPTAPPREVFTHPITVSGRALDEGGKPIPGAKVYLASVRAGSKRLAETKADVDGRYEFLNIPLPIEPVQRNASGRDSGAFEVFGAADGKAFAWRPRKSYFPDRNNDEPGYDTTDRDLPERFYADEKIVLDLKFTESRSITGRIVDEQGMPVAGAKLAMRRCEPLQKDDRLAQGIVNSAHEFSALNEPEDVPAEIKVRQTDADGRFEFSGVPAECLFWFDVGHPNYAGKHLSAATTRRTLPKTQYGSTIQTDEIALTFFKVRDVPVRVLLADTEQPAVKVFVSAGSAEASHWQETDDKGFVTLRLPPGEYRTGLLPARGARYLLTELKEKLVVGAVVPTEPVTLRLRAAAAIDVTIVDADTGEPIPDVDLWMSDPVGPVRETRDEVSFRSWEKPTAYVERPQSDKDGKLRVLVEPGDHRIGVVFNHHPKDYEPDLIGQVITCPASQTVEATFKLKRLAPVKENGGNANRDLRSKPAAGPGDPRRAQADAVITAAELEKLIQLKGRELFFGRMELSQEFEMLWPTKDQKLEKVVSKGTARWLKNTRLTRIDSERMVPGTGTVELRPEQWTTGFDGVRSYSWNRAAKLISYGAMRPGAIAYSPNLFFWGRTAISSPQPMFGPNPKITRATRDGREEIDVVHDVPEAKLSIRYVGIVPDHSYLPTRVETRVNDRLESQIEFQDFFQPHPGVWAPKTIVWTAWSADNDANGKPIVTMSSKMTVTKLELGENAKLRDEEFQLKLSDNVKVVDAATANAAEQTRAGRGSPDPALDPTAGLPNSDEETRREETAPPLSKVKEVELFASRLRSIAPRDWVVERKDRAFRLRGPEVPAGKERAQILLWFDDVWVGSSDALAKRNKSLPTIGHMNNTRIGRHYFTRNTAAEELWPEYGLQVRLIEPVDQIAIATADVLQSEVISLNWFDAALVRYIEIGPDGRRVSQLLNLDGSPIGITAATKCLVVGKLPDPQTATNETDRGSAFRQLKTFDELRAEAKQHGVRVISLSDFERYTEAVVKEGRGFRTRRIDDANQLQIPECLTTGRGLVVVPLVENQTEVETAPPKGLEFLKPYPELHRLSLDMTEPQFLEIVKQQELKTRKTVDGEKVTHHIALGDGHTLIVMFDKDSKCSGIQRVRGVGNSVGHFNGRVTGPDGKPLSRARVLIVPWTEKPKVVGAVRAETDADGRFEFDAPDMTYTKSDGHSAQRQGLLIATADGFAPDWMRTWGNDLPGFRSHSDPVEGAALNLRLAKNDVPIQGRFLNHDGSPLVGARVEIIGLMIPQQYDLDAHLAREVKFTVVNVTDYEREIGKPDLLPGLAVETKTDAEGRFKLSGIGRDRLVQLKVSAPSVLDTELEVMTRDTPNVRTRLGGPKLSIESQSVIYGAGFTVQLKPRQDVELPKARPHAELGNEKKDEKKDSSVPPELRVLRKPAVLLPDHWIVQAVGFDNDGKELVTASNQSFITIRRWDVVGRKLISEIKLQADKHGRAVRDGTLMFSGDRRRVVAATDAYVGIWDATTGKLLKQLPFQTKEGIYDCAIDMLDCTPDLSVIVGHRALPGRLTLSFDAHVIVWDGVSGNVLQTVIDKGATDLKDIDLSTDGKRLVSTNGGGARIWETSTGQLLRSIPNDNTGRKHSEPDVSSQYTSHVWSVQFSPDGKQLAMGDILGVKLIDATSGKLLQQLEGPYRYSSSGGPGLVFSKDGQRLARLGTQEKAEGDKHHYVVPIWSTRTGARLSELHTEANDAAFSDDGQRLAVVFSDMQQALSVWTLSGDASTTDVGRALWPVSGSVTGKSARPTNETPAANVEQTAGPGPHSRQDRVEENGHYVGKTAAEFIDKFQPTWGNEKLGLQYGIALTKPQPQRTFRGRDGVPTYERGERVSLIVFFRNVSDKPIKFDTAPDFFGNTPKVLNAKGEPIALENIPLLGHIPHDHEKLEPGEALGPFYLNFGLGENSRPGQQHWHPYFKTPVASQYKLTHSVSINVAGQKDGEPSKRDDITTGTMEFEIVDGVKTATDG